MTLINERNPVTETVRNCHSIIQSYLRRNPDVAGEVQAIEAAESLEREPESLIQRRILRCLKDSPNKMNPAEIASATGIRLVTARKALRELREDSFPVQRGKPLGLKTLYWVGEGKH